MKIYCPECDNMVKYLVKEEEEVYSVKGEDIPVQASVSYCAGCGEKLFNKELDSENLEQAYSKYRIKNDVLSPEEIAEIRQKYGLTQRALSLLLRWGEVTINRYENGAVPDHVHNEVLQFIKEPQNMQKLFEKTSHLISSNDKVKLQERLDQLLKKEQENHFYNCLENHIIGDIKIGEYTGYSKYNLNKLENVFLRICEICKNCFKTKALKIAWYIDFYSFKKRTVSITGSPYTHLSFGPVPENYELVLANMAGKGLLDIEEIEFEDVTGSRFSSNVNFDTSVFNDVELEIIDKVILKLKNRTGKELINMTHKEKAYVKTEDKELISYIYAEDLFLTFN